MAINPPSIQNSNTNSHDYSNPVVQIVLLLIVLVIFSWFVLKPKLSHSTETRTNLKAAEAQLESVKQDQEALGQLLSDLREATDEVSKVDEALPLSGRISKVYVLLDTMVRTSGMSLSLISSDDSSDVISAADKGVLENPYQPGRELHVVTLNTSVSGTMEQFKNLLQLIETSGRVLDIADVKVIGGEPLTKFEISVKAYSYEKLDETPLKK